MPVKLIIFDLDGTLIDSSIDITNALNYAMEPYGLRRLAVEDTIKMVGEGITRLIEKMLGSVWGNKVPPRAPEEVSKKSHDFLEVQADVMNRFLNHYTEHILDYTKEYPGVRETLERLINYKKAVISNKRESLSRMVLDGLALSKYFDIVIGSDTTPERKPSPVPVLKVLSELSVHPADALIVGDSNYDVDAGKAAGVTTVAVTYGYRPIEMIRHADYLIGKMTDLIPLLEKMKD